MRIHTVINAVQVLKHLRSKTCSEGFLRLLQVKYGILTILTRLLGSVVVRASASRFSRMGSIRCDCGGILRD